MNINLLAVLYGCFVLMLISNRRQRIKKTANSSIAVHETRTIACIPSELPIFLTSCLHPNDSFPKTGRNIFLRIRPNVKRPIALSGTTPVSSMNGTTTTTTSNHRPGAPNARVLNPMAIERARKNSPHRPRE